MAGIVCSAHAVLTNVTGGSVENAEHPEGAFFTHRGLWRCSQGVGRHRHPAYVGQETCAAELDRNELRESPNGAVFSGESA